MSDQIKIREARSKDVTTLVDFNIRMARETENMLLDPGIVTHGVKAILEDRKNGFYLIAEVDGEVVGSLMVTTEWSDWRNGAFWWIQSVYVEPGFRRRGVFRALYEEVRERARKTEQVCGCRLYVERDNTSAQATYARIGLEETKYKVFEELLQ
jgi:ribosomal protein S18 acetylase RimI-like enzyme